MDKSTTATFASTIEPYLAGGAPLPPAEAFPDKPAGLGEKGLKIMSILEKCPGGYGAAIVRESNGEILEGSVYTTLRNLERKGFVAQKGEESSGRERERKYRLTDLGMRTLAAHRLSDLALRLANEVASKSEKRRKSSSANPGKSPKSADASKAPKKAPKAPRSRVKKIPAPESVTPTEELPPEAGDSGPT